MDCKLSTSVVSEIQLIKSIIYYTTFYIIIYTILLNLYQKQGAIIGSKTSFCVTNIFTYDLPL